MFCFQSMNYLLSYEGTATENLGFRTNALRKLSFSNECIQILTSPLNIYSFKKIVCEVLDY